jgi:hypothetical protein
MVERQLLTLCAAMAIAGCAEDRQAFMLDNICRNQFAVRDQFGTPSPGCRLSGDATFTTGISSDSIAVKLGPNGGRLEIALAAIPAAHQATWSFDALVASRRPEGSVLGRPEIDWGSCGVICPGVIEGVEVDLTDEVRWAVLIDGRPGTATQFAQFAASPIPADAVITLRGSDIDILDVRTPGFDENAIPPTSDF